MNPPPFDVTYLLLAYIQVTDITVSSANGTACVYNSATLRRLATERPNGKACDLLDLDPPILNALGAYKSRWISPYMSIPVNVAREIVEGALSVEATR